MVKMYKPKVLRFGGKWYTYYKYTRSKRAADDLMADMRKKGWSARDVPRVAENGKTYWLIYRRKK